MNAYVIAAWLGVRRCPDARALNDPGFYLRQHLKAARSVLDASAKIITVLSGSVPDGTRLEGLGEDIPLLIKPNAGMSYGAWSYFYDIMGHDEFDYIAFVEDDYIPTCNPFAELVPIMQREKIDYICGQAGYWSDNWHAAISNGVVSNSACKAAAAKTGHLPFGPSDQGYTVDNQVEWSQGFVKAGQTIKGYTPWYQAPYWDGRVTVFGSTEHAAIWVPIQMT